MAKSAKKKRQPSVIAAPSVRGLAVKKAKRLPIATVPASIGKKVQVPKKLKALRLSAASQAPDLPDRLTRLLVAIAAVSTGTKQSPRTQKLLNSGVPKMAQKLVEEAAEVAIDAVRGVRDGFINESADLLYNLVVLWSALGVTPDDIWAEMDRREATLGLAEKLPKPVDSGDL